MTDKKPEKKETPVYGKIVDDVRSRIESGQWKRVRSFPERRELCNLYGVARGTLKAAFPSFRSRAYQTGPGKRNLCGKAGWERECFGKTGG